MTQAEIVAGFYFPIEVVALLPTKALPYLLPTLIGDFLQCVTRS